MNSGCPYPSSSDDKQRRLQKERHSMKLQFGVQQYQINAVDTVVETFAGQSEHDSISYRIDPGKVGSVVAPALFEAVGRSDAGLRNAETALSST